MAFSGMARMGFLAVTLAVSIAYPDGRSKLAYADEDLDLSRARAKFQQGTELEQAGNFAAALQVFRDVGQVRMTPQVRFHIASCEENLGRLVAALGGFELAQTGAESVGPEFQKEVEERIEDLRARIPKLMIKRGHGAEAATIELDGVRLGANSIGTPIPLDPGPHAILAEAPGYQRYLSTVDLVEKDANEVTVALEQIPQQADTDLRQGTANRVSVVPTPQSQSSRVVPYVIGGIGAVALLNAGVFYLLRRGKESDLQDLCGTDHDCTNANPRPLVGAEVSRSGDLNDRMRLYTTVSTVSALAGIVGLGVAGAWVITERKQPKPITAWAVRPSAPGAELAGLSLVSAF